MSTSALSSETAAPVTLPEADVPMTRRLLQGATTSGVPEKAGWPLVARFACIGDDGCALLEMPGRMGMLVRARTTIALPVRGGAEVLVVCEGGDPSRPIIVGVLQPTSADAEPQPNLRISADGRALELEARRELVLRCGPASIRLTADGRVTVEGRQILSRSSGANRIKGAVVDIN